MEADANPPTQGSASIDPPEGTNPGVTEILAQALKLPDVKRVLVIAVYENDSAQYMSSQSERAAILWDLEIAKHIVLSQVLRQMG